MLERERCCRERERDVEERERERGCKLFKGLTLLILSVNSREMTLSSQNSEET